MVFPLHFFSSFFLVKHLFFTQPTQLFTLFIKSFQKLRYILRLHIDNIYVTKIKKYHKQETVAYPLHFFLSFFPVKHLFLHRTHHFFTLFSHIVSTFRYIIRLHIDNINVTNKNYTMLNKLINLYLKSLQLLILISLPNVIYHIIMS